jgi:hypothetical protein
MIVYLSDGFVKYAIKFEPYPMVVNTLLGSASARYIGAKNKSQTLTGRDGRGARYKTEK